MEEEKSENAKIDALTKFDEALRAYSASFESDEAALNFLLVKDDTEQLASFLTLIGNQRDFDKDRKPPWDHFELEPTKLILVSIFSHLEAPDLKSLRFVCKQFCEIVTPLMDAKTALKYTDKERSSRATSDNEELRFDLYLTEIMELTPSFIWKTHQFRHVEINIDESYMWVCPNVVTTFECLFLSPCMFSVETLRIKGFLFDLFDIELATSIPACLARFWTKLKSITFLHQRTSDDLDGQVYLAQQHPVRLTADDQISELEEIHFELYYRGCLDWRFLEMCPNIKVIKIDTYPSERYTVKPYTIPPMTRCLELILPRLKRKKIEGLHLKFGVRDETEAIAEFVTAVAAKGSLKDVVYRISTSKQDCLSFINSVALPLESAEFVVSAETSEDIAEILKALHSKGYFQLETFKFTCAQFSFKKQQLTLTIAENAEGAAGSLANLLPIWLPGLQMEQIQPHQVQDETEAVPMEVDTEESELKSATPLEASNAFCNAVDHFISNFGSTEEAVDQLLRMKETVWPNVTTFLYTCWASKLYDGEDWRMNPCVLEAICKRSSVASLKSMRLVCKRWSKLASIWLERTSVVTSENKETNNVKKNRDRGVQINDPMFYKLHPLLDPSQSWNIHLNHLEILTCTSNWSWEDHERHMKTLFLNPATANLESLRILNFSTDLADQILKYYIPKYLKKLKSLTLVAPFSANSHWFDQKPVESFMPLEKFVVQITDNWRPSWKFLNLCPNLKCFKLIGSKFVEDRDDCRSETFFECLQEVWPFLRNKSISKLGLKFECVGDMQPIADFVTKIASLGSLKDVSYEIDAYTEHVSNLVNLLELLPVPSRRAKLVLRSSYDRFGLGVNQQFNLYVTSALDKLAARGYMSKLQQLDFGVCNREPNPLLLVRDFSLIVTKNAVALSCKNEMDFSISEDYRDRLAAWFPEMNYVCYPWQVKDEKALEVRTRLLELLVPEGSVFLLPGMAGRSYHTVINPEGRELSPAWWNMPVLDASVVHRYALAVPSALRRRDLCSRDYRMHIFSKVELDEFVKVRDQEEEGVQKMDISSWNVPENLAMVRTITTNFDAPLRWTGVGSGSIFMDIRTSLLR